MATWWQKIKAAARQHFGSKGMQEKWGHAQSRYGMDYATQGGTFNRLKRHESVIGQLSKNMLSARRKRNRTALMLLSGTAGQMLASLNEEYNRDPVITRSNVLAQKANANLYKLQAVINSAKKGLSNLPKYKKGTTVGPTAEMGAEEDIKEFGRAYWPKRRKFKKRCVPALVSRFGRIE